MKFGFYQSYLIHLIRSNNRHGTHSPFVYQLLDEVIYDSHVYEVYESIVKNYKDSSSEKLPIRFLKLLYRLSKEFKPDGLIVFNKANRIEIDCLSMINPAPLIHDNLNLKNDKKVIVYLDDVLSDKSIITDLMPLLTGNSFIIIKGIHSNDLMNSTWKKIMDCPESTVTIDLFYSGLVFHRPGQVKEHFNIRF